MLNSTGLVNSTVLDMLASDMNTVGSLVVNLVSSASMMNVTGLTDLLAFLASTGLQQSLAGLVTQVLAQAGVDTSMLSAVMLALGQYINTDLTSLTPGHQCPTCVDCDLTSFNSMFTIQNCSSPSQLYCQVQNLCVTFCLKIFFG
jgi:hypothetical protein